MKKRILALILVVVMAAVLLPTVGAADTIKIVIDGKTVSANVAPVVMNNTTYVPVAIIVNYIGGDSSWNGAKSQATIQTAAYKAIYTIDSPKYTLNGAIKTLPNSATCRALNGRTMVPVRALEAFGAAVDYKDGTVYVNYFSNMKGDLKLDGSTTVQPIAEAAGAALVKKNSGSFTYAVTGTGSSAGIKSVAAGSADIGNSSRELKDSELADGLVPYAICNDAIVIICNPANGITGLTTQQAADIFLGKIKNWQDVGGANAPIIVNSRETTSGTLSALKELLLGNQDVVETATPHASNGLMVEAISQSPYAIGFCSMGYLDSSVKGIPLNGALPTTASVQNKTYPLSRELYCVTKGQAKGLAAMFIDYLRSDEAQNSIIAAEHYVKLVG